MEDIHFEFLLFFTQTKSHPNLSHNAWLWAGYAMGTIQSLQPADKYFPS